MSIAKFSVIRHQPYPQRTEHVNIGIVVFLADGRVRVKMASNLRKLTALDPTADLETVRGQEDAIAELFAESNPEKRSTIAELFGPWRLDGSEGTLTYFDDEDLDRAIAWALEQTCEPTSKRRIVNRPPQSRLFIDLKKTFAIYGWLGHEPRHISERMIVSKYPILPEEGVFADFAVGSQRLSVFETLDMRHVSNLSGKRTEGLAKAMVLSAASLTNNALTNCIVAGSHLDYAKETTKLLNRVSARFYAYESVQDMNELFRDMGHATGKPPLELPS